MSQRLALSVLVIVTLAFAAYTTAVVAGHGYTGFLTLAWSEAWGGQMFVDLVIALVLFAIWMRQDAARQDLPYWPYFLLILTTGSIGALGYLIHRSVKELRGTLGMAATRSA